MLVQAKGFSCEAFDAVAGYRGAESAGRNAQAQPRIGFMIGQYRQTEKRIGEFFAAPLHVSKFGRLVQTLARLERQFTDRQPWMRASTDRVACGPLRGAEPAIDGRSWWPCARENRGYGLGANYWD